MDEQLEYGFATAVFVLEHVAEKITPAEAESMFGETAKENFWRVWPTVRMWVDGLWQRLEDERGAAAMAVEDEEIDEVGGGG